MQLSHNDIRQLIEAELNKALSGSASEMPRYWVRDVFDDYFVYSDYGSKTYQRTYSIDASKIVTLGDPTEVVEVTTYAPVVRTGAFSLSGMAQFSTAGDVVTRKGKIFAAGDYPDVGYSMTPEELQNAVQNFTPAKLDLEHLPHRGIKTVLDGKLGSLDAIELGEDGKTLFGTVSLPSWLDAALTEGERLVSATWNKATKLLEGLALTVEPRLSDAALFSAYATFAGKRHSASDIADLQSIHDLVVKQGAECSPTGATFSAPNPREGKGHKPNKEKRMSFFEDMKALFSKYEPENDGVEGEGTDASTTSAAPIVQPTVTHPTPAAPAPDPEKAAMFAQIQELKRKDREREAQATVDALITQGKLYPAERAVALATFSRAMEDDERDNTLVTFSKGDGTTVEVTRAQLLEAQYQARPSHTLTQEQVAAFALPNAGGESKADKEKEEVEKLLSMSEVGRAALASKNGHGK